MKHAVSYKASADFWEFFSRNIKNKVIKSLSYGRENPFILGE
jgi:hypothetical protein